MVERDTDYDGWKRIIMKALRGLASSGRRGREALWRAVPAR